MKIGSLCTGYGGLDMAVQAVFGAQLAWWSDIEPGPIKVMSEHSDAQNLGDLKEVDWSSVEPIDILTAGYPCQPFSNAGKRLGTEDPRHIWPWIERAIGVLRPRVVILENVAAHLNRGFDVVLADLAALGYDTRWSVVRASDVGAVHPRPRLYIVAVDADSSGLIRVQGGATYEQHDPEGVGGSGVHVGIPCEYVEWGRYGELIAGWGRVAGRPAPHPVSDSGLANPQFFEWAMGLPEGWITRVPGVTRAEQVKLAGNGVVPQQAEYAIRTLMAAL